LLAATVRSFAHMPLGISGRNSATWARALTSQRTLQNAADLGLSRIAFSQTQK